MKLLHNDREYIFKRIRRISKKLAENNYTMSLSITVCDKCAQIEYYDTDTKETITENVEID